MNGRVVAICIHLSAKGKMQYVEEVQAITGCGLQGDSYCTGDGSFNKVKGVGNRQVTFMNATFLAGTGFSAIDTRRNIFVEGVELMPLIPDIHFTAGEAVFGGKKYCDPCDRPDTLSGKTGFKRSFLDRGGLIAEVIEGGIIRVGDLVVTPEKNYQN